MPSSPLDVYLRFRLLAHMVNLFSGFSKLKKNSSFFFVLIFILLPPSSLPPSFLEPLVLFSVIHDGSINLLSYQQCVRPSILNLSTIYIISFIHICRDHRLFAPLKLRLLEIFFSLNSLYILGISFLTDEVCRYLPHSVCLLTLLIISLSVQILPSMT